MEIDMMLTLSTAHICQDTAEKMESHLLDLTIYEKGKHGWLCLDCDGEKIENLPTYEW